MTDTERAAITGRPLLLYDGVCPLCHGVVEFLLAHDPAGTMRFAPLESPLAREIIARLKISPLPDGVLLITNVYGPRERVYARSDAIAAALQTLSRPWRLLGRLLRLMPRRLREFGYTLVARLRYRIFGRYNTCPIPPPSLRHRLLGAMSE